MQRILVLRGGALGDFLVTLPALSALRRRWSKARIELAGNATAAVLGRHRGLIDAVHSQHEARWGTLFSDAPLPVPMAEWLESFDLVLNYWPDPGGELRRRFPLRPSQTFLHADAMPAVAPAAAHYCAPLRELGIEVTDFLHRLSPLADPVRAAASPGHPIGQVRNPKPAIGNRSVALHPGSGSPRKNWPLERWVELCAALEKGGRSDLMVITGEADTGAATGLAGAGRRHAHQLPFETLVDELAASRLFIGHDSGISHLAAACGVPCILLFGPTDPAMWAPRGANVRVIRHGPDLESISVAEVHAAATGWMLA
ncbi:MAG: glycosyltransferase family 9 protein [Opitutus sp.]